MANTKFTVGISMKAFFADYRSEAKLCVKEDMKVVSDLENKISRIFQIQNFHLICDGQLLPSCEDICVIKSGDSICAIPNDAKTEILRLDEQYYVTNYNTEEDKYKKRRNCRDECPVKEKKSKKKKKNSPLPDGWREFTEQCVNVNSEGHSGKSYGKNLKTGVENKIQIKSIEMDPVACNNKGAHLYSSTPYDVEYNVDVFNFKNHSKSNNYNNHLKESLTNRIDHLHTLVATSQNNQSAEEQNKIDRCAKNSRDETNNSDLLNNVNSVESDKNYNSPTKSLKLGSYTTGDSMVQNNKNSNYTNTSLEAMQVDDLQNHSQVEVKSSQNNETPIFDERAGHCSSINHCDFSNVSTQGNVKVDNQTFRQIHKKPCLLTSLYHKKRKSISWSTSPLSKSMNHVKITKHPCEKIEIDSTRFCFKLSDAGVVPIPAVENEKECNQFLSSNKESLKMLVSNVDNSSDNFAQGASNTSGCSQILFSLMSGVEKLKDSNAINSGSNSDIGKIDKGHLETFDKAHKGHLEIFDKAPSVGSESFTNISPTNGNVSMCTGKDFDSDLTEARDVSDIEKKQTDLKLWKQTVQQKITESMTKLKAEHSKNLLNYSKENGNVIICSRVENVPVEDEREKSVSPLEPRDMKNMTPTVAPKITENDLKPRSVDENKDGKLLDASSAISNNVMKLNSQSNQIKRRYLRETSGVGYYLKLLGKMNEDLSKSISILNRNESECIPETVKGETPQELEQDESEKDCNDFLSVSSINSDFVTRRKRKRKHRRKTRITTPTPSVQLHKIIPKERSLSICSKPKIHIRFNNISENSKTLNEILNSDGNTQVDTTDKKINILQHVSLASAVINDEDQVKLLPKVKSSSLNTTDVQTSVPMCENSPSFCCNDDNDSRIIFEDLNVINSSASLLENITPSKSLESAKASLIRNLECFKQDSTIDMDESVQNVTISSLEDENDSVFTERISM